MNIGRVLTMAITMVIAIVLFPVVNDVVQDQLASATLSTGVEGLLGLFPIIYLAGTAFGAFQISKLSS